MGGKTALLILALFPLVAWGKEYFTAAVFEHRPRDEQLTAPREISSSNLKYYEKAAKLAARKGADIIVFNEFSIFPYKKEHTRKFLRQFAETVPDPESTQFNPCKDGGEDMPILSTLSCLAKKNNLYLVADLVDEQPCEGTCDAQVQTCDQKCSEDGVLLYNTAVAFDRKGYLIARYHKKQLYFEMLDSPIDPEYVTFTTEFGKFGLFICFDSIWASSKTLAAEYGIDTAIFPTYWFDDIVPLNAVEWQQSWAIANRVNFLAANTNTPGSGSLGSGIYSKYHGALVYSYEPDAESKLLIARVPTSPTRDAAGIPPEGSITVIQEQKTFLKEETGDLFPVEALESVAGSITDLYKEYRVYKPQTENYTLTKLEKDEGTIEACDNGFCCRLEYSAESADDAMSEEYYLGAFSGHNNVRGYFHWCEETCLLLRCNAHGGKPCVSQSSRASTVFKHVKMSAHFTAERVYPTVSLDKFRLASRSDWKFERKDSFAVLEFEPEFEEPLLKVGLLGRCYDKDPPFVPFYRP